MLAIQWQKQEQFIISYATIPSITWAAYTTRIARSTHYSWLEHDTQNYRQRWQNMLDLRHKELYDEQAVRMEAYKQFYQHPSLVY